MSDFQQKAVGCYVQSAKREKKPCQPRVLYLARLSFRIEGRVSSFPDKPKLKGFSTTRPALEKVLT